MTEKKLCVYEIEDVFKTYDLLTHGTGFYSYISDKIRELRQSGHEGTARAYNSSLSSMKKFLGSRDFPFNKLSPQVITMYNKQLLASGVCENTICFYLHNIKALYRKGCQEMGLEQLSPFREVHFKTEKTVKRCLETDVIKKVSRLELEEGSTVSLARDIFMFSFYTRGMSFVDIALLKKADLFPDEICYRRHKTGQLMRVGMNRQIIRILTKYENTVGEYVFPLFTEEQEPYAGYKNAYHKIRYALKKISCSLGLSTPLRLHAARHSWATIAKEHGIPVHIIGECLGHMSEETTRIYLKDLDRSVLDDVNNQIAEIVG